MSIDILEGAGNFQSLGVETSFTSKIGTSALARQFFATASTADAAHPKTQGIAKESSSPSIRATYETTPTGATTGRRLGVGITAEDDALLKNYFPGKFDVTIATETETEPTVTTEEPVPTWKKYLPWVLGIGAVAVVGYFVLRRHPE